MNRKLAVTLASGTLAVGAVATLAVPAQADSYQTTSAMAQVVKIQQTETASAEASPQGVVGVAKALYAGFKAAHAPRAAGNVARLASVLGFAADASNVSSTVEAAYFDR